MPSRQVQKEQTRERLIETAYGVFSAKGIMTARMSDVAAAAGVSHGTVFLHFGSQEAFIGEVVGFYGQRIAMRTHALAETCRSLEEFLGAHLDALGEFEPFYTRLVIEGRFLPKEAQDALISVQSAISFHFSRVLEREQARRANSAVPVHMLFNMWMGLVHYYLANGDLFAPEGHVLQRYGRTLIVNFMKLLMGEAQGNGAE